MDEYAAFSDESYSTAERYRSIAVFSFPKAFLNEISRSLKIILNDSGVFEFKWEKLRNLKYKFCAIKLIDYIIEDLTRRRLRIDTVIWDTQDSRHNVQSRDDLANFERMFYHLLNNSMKRRERASEWEIFPDQRFGIDWSTVHECLQSTGNWTEYLGPNLFGEEYSGQFFRIKTFHQVDSKSDPCSQVADFFAGISVFSKLKYAQYKAWVENRSSQLKLFGDDDPPEKPTNSENARFEVLCYFNSQCKKHRLGVSFDRKQCLCTPDPSNPINFWHYKPQSSLDRAPTKNQIKFPFVW